MAGNKKSARSSSKPLKPPKLKSPYDPNYFMLPHPALGTLVLSAILYMAMVTFSPNSLPEFLWPFAPFGKYMSSQHFNLVIGCWIFTLIAHSLEAAYAGKLCQDRGYTAPVTFKWAVSTFIFGFPSMIRLSAHKPRSKSN